jgi:hypothetical protein
MNPSTHLFELIKSLEKSEKRYFRMYASLQKGTKNYLKLFDAVDSMKLYDEDVLKKMFRNERFIRQLTFTKNYLYNLIFKSLYSYYTKHSIEHRLNDLIFRCGYFYRRALYNEFGNAVRFGKKLSLEYERFGYFIQFSSYEKILVTERHLPLIDENSILSQEEIITEKIANLSVYDSYSAMLTGIYRQEGRTRDEILFNYLERIKESPLLTSAEYALSATAKERYYYLHQMISDIYGDLDMVYYYCTKRLEVLQSKPEPFVDRVNNHWRDVLMHLILTSIRQKDSEKLLEYLHLLELHTYDSQTEKINVFLVESYLSVNLILTEKRWDKINELMESIEKGLALYKGKIEAGLELILYDVIIKMFMGASDYKGSIKYMNFLLNHPFISVRRDIEYNARLLNLIIHYELQNLDYLEYLILSTYRFLYKRKKIYKLETYVMNFIKRLSKVSSEIELKDNFHHLQKDLRSIYRQPHEKNIFLHFDYLEWVNKKIKEFKR